MAKPLTRTQEEYLAWLILPSDLREPHTKGAWAEAHGVSHNTLCLWQKIPLFLEQWQDGIKNAAQSPERTEMLLDSLFKKGINGDVKSAQLYLQATGQLQKETNINIRAEKSSDLSDSELEALIAEYAQKERKQRSDDSKIEKSEIPKLRKVIKDAEIDKIK